jgi:PKD repeat protein
MAILSDLRWQKVAIAVLVTLVMLVSVVPAASALEQSSEIRLTTTTAQEYYPRAVQDSEGNLHIIYLVLDNGNDQLWYRKLDPQGAILAGPMRLGPTNTTGRFSDTGIALAIDSSDRVHITFSAQYTTDASRDIFYLQLSKAGAITVAAKRVYASATASSSPDIDADGSGNAYIVWQEEAAAIYWIKLTATGTVSRPSQVISGTVGYGGSIWLPRVGASTVGSSYVVWEQRQNSLARASIWFTLLDASGVDTVTAKQVYSSPVMEALQVAASMDKGASVLHVTFTQGLISQTLTEVRHLQVDKDGAVSASVQVASTTIGEVFIPDISVLTNGDTYVVYTMRDNPINGIWHSYLWVRWEANGTAAAPVVVGQANQTSQQPCVAAGSKLTAIIFQRSNDLYLVTFKVPTSTTNNAPTASLTARPSDAQVGQSVTFDGSASTDPDSGDHVAEWNFQYGDGSGSGWVSQSTITHSYSVAGTYTATLKVRDTHDAESTAASASVRVTGGGTTNKAPVARISASPNPAKVAQNIVFDGTSSTDVDGSVAQYRFDLGDGTVVGWTTTSQTIHAFAAAGSYSATLQVKDDKGKTSENTASVTVAVEAANVVPTATIVSIHPNPAVVGDSITFTGAGTDPDGTITAYAWDSNLDGVLSDQASFSKTSLSIGIHTITFKVKDDEGAWSDAATATLEVKKNFAPTLVVLTNVSSVDTETVVEFLVRYIDPENDAPTSSRLYYGIGGDYNQEALIAADLTDTNYRDGKDYYFKTKLGKAGTYKFYFEFQNAKNSKQISEVKTLQVKQAKGFLPGPGVAAVALAMLAVCVLSMRRRGSGTGPPGYTG